jgi:L-lysine 2,3-aminomutase
MSDNCSEAEHFKKNWQHQLSEAFKTVDALCQYLQLSPNDLPLSVPAAKSFALKVPLSFAACMEKGNPRDPLLRQVLPVHDEMRVFPGFSNDPVGDIQSATTAGVLHKYHGRVLLINTGSCAINCRYCFRRNFPYSEQQITQQSKNSAIDYIKNDSSISEVILSGGDPLLLSDEKLNSLLSELSAIAHIKRIRIHSRLPIVLPARITAELIKLLTQSATKIIVIVHCNHANEISDRVISAFKLLKNAGIALFNQSVLLKDVNDDTGILMDLSEALFSHGVIPYYLHLLDKATGTGHFEVPESEALQLITQVQARLPGYLVPKLVKERAGSLSKETLLG